MKYIFSFSILILLGFNLIAQVDTIPSIDTVVIMKHSKSDTIRIGNILIIKKNKKEKNNEDVDIVMGRKNKKRKRLSNVSTNWGIVDLGFSNYIDNTDYTNTGNYLVNRPNFPNLDKNDFKLRMGKSVNVNIWIFMQKLNLAEHYINLKYGFGLELNNYRYKSSISYKEGGTVPYTNNTLLNSPFIFRDSIQFKKNKLAVDYLTIPVMLNFVSHPGQGKGISLSIGVSGGYLYSQRNKQRSSERGKDKNRGDYDLERFKFSYIAELGIGPIRFYGSYSPRSLYQHDLNIKPYNIGIRLGNW